ncbi:MAG TPA: zinc-binding dehydrogenase [Acidimicrobiales bacterium]|nr:zinc-binding dehydrogenase [Acidimicrobiales bacterium]
MRAALLGEIGAHPVLASIDGPSGDATADVVEIEMLAAPLNPLDVTVAAGRFGGGHPPLPYVPGIEGVGRRGDSGALVYAMGAGLGIARNGCAAERFNAPAASLLAVPDGVAPALAAALGTPGLAAWLALEWKGALQSGETVVVLGASGAGGQLALQAARLLCAGRVVAVGRGGARLDAARRFADEAVEAEGDDYTARLAAACPDGAQLVLDFVWGHQLEGALPVLSLGGRVVQIGAAASPTASLPSALLRARRATLYGFTNFAAPPDLLAATYEKLVTEAAAGRLVLDGIESFPLDRIGEAWELLLQGGSKVVMRP